MERTGEMVLGISGGIIGIIAGVIGAFVGFIDIGFGGEGNIFLLGFGTLIFSILGIIAGALVKSKTQLAGWLMIIAAIGGVLTVKWFYFISGPLFLIGGLMALFRKEKTNKEKKG